MVSNPRSSHTGEERVPRVVSAVQTFCMVCNPLVSHGNLLGFQNLPMRSSFGDLAFPQCLEEGERAGKFPPGCCRALAMASLLSTVRVVKQEKASGTCLHQGSRLTALSDGCLVLSSLNRNVLSTLLYLLLFRVNYPFRISLLPLLLQLVSIC